MVKQAFVMQMGVWEAVKKLLSNGEGAPVRASVESARRAHRELRRYAQLKYPYAMKQEGQGSCKKPEIIFSLIDNKLGRVPSEDMTRASRW